MLDAYQQRLRKHVPKCLDQVQADLLEASAAGEDGATHLIYELRGARDERHARVWGFDLGRLRGGVGEGMFVSPIDLTWGDSSERARVFDSDLHGYHGELGCSAKVRGEGDPEEAFACPGCSGGTFAVRVRLSYWEAVRDLWEDEPGTNVEDYFCNFELLGTCSRCHHLTTICAMDL
ncbi:MAG: hypothetical protein KF878_36205 [Planctomycetes bacterium]|nr:hypothetical protein [Planctomycetota bacterium]